MSSFEMMVKVMTITVECFYNNDELIGCMFKCLQSFVYELTYWYNVVITVIHVLIQVVPVPMVLCCSRVQRILSAFIHKEDL